LEELKRIEEAAYQDFDRKDASAIGNRGQPAFKKLDRPLMKGSVVQTLKGQMKGDFDPDMGY
jgi:hypothetical protein